MAKSHRWYKKSNIDRAGAPGFNMKPFRTPLRSVVEINFNLLLAAGCGYVAWVIWPQEPEWWGLGVIGTILALAAVGGVMKALRLMMAVHAKDRAIADYLAQGGSPRSSRLATKDDLKDAGMLDG